MKQNARRDHTEYLQNRMRLARFPRPPALLPFIAGFLNLPVVFKSNSDSFNYAKGSIRRSELRKKVATFFTFR